MEHPDLTPELSELGRSSDYESTYNPRKLFAIPRKGKREAIGITGKLPFYGADLWNHYEVSWLNTKGKPIVALAEIFYSCDTPYIIESKSMKLYFNTLNNTQFNSVGEVEAIVKQDIEKCVGGEVVVKLIPLTELKGNPYFYELDGECLDHLDIQCHVYMPQPTLLKTENNTVEEILFSNLLKSNCLVTHQPDWGSIQIKYKGPKIVRETLLQYLVSFRNHNEFHEQCIERIFIDLIKHCKPQELSVYGRYTRRGGLDINPYRSTQNNFQEIKNLRLCRQ